jgi:linoleate 9S-lipoxygenase
MFRKIRLRWLKLKYMCMLKKLKESYKNMVKDLVEAGATLETFQQRIFMETSFAIPLGVSLSSYPSLPGSDRPRTLYI